MALLLKEKTLAERERVRLVAETSSLEKARAIESRLPPGKYQIRLYLLRPLSEAVFDQLNQSLANQAHLLSPVEDIVDTPSTVFIRFEKRPQPGISQMAGILWVIPALALITLIGISIFKIESWIKAATPLILGGLAIFAVAVVASRRTAHAS